MAADVRRVATVLSTDSEEQRSFFQSRLQLFTGYLCLISGVFYVVDMVFSIPALGAAVIVLWTPKLLHLIATVLAGALWLVLRQRTVSDGQLRSLDVGATILLSTCYALMALAALDAGRLGELMTLDPWRAATDPLMACSYVVLLRALVIPSRARRTIWITALAMLPIVVVGPYVLSHHMSGLELRFASLDLAMWSVAATTVAGISSRVIFGLRSKVAQVRRLGQYTLEQKIGEGGMGEVYRASPAMLRRPTAIKLLPPDRMGEASLRRFEREVQLTASLTHPNTVAVFDYGRTPDGIFYYAMEYFDGVNLDELVAHDGPQPPGRVIHLLVQVCGSLAEAHGVGLIHRDIKPANILLVERGGIPDVVKVVDFGLAKHVDPIDSEVTATVTTTNIIRGTPLYLSPEAIKNDPDLDARSDLYALGAVGYFLLTGQPVFQSDSVVEVLSHHLNTEPVPPSQRAPRPLPPGLDALILMCLAKDPNDRPADARALQAALIGCPCEPPWSSNDAEAWWKDYRATPPDQQQPAPDANGRLSTVMIDITDRVAREPSRPE